MNGDNTLPHGFRKFTELEKMDKSGLAARAKLYQKEYDYRLPTKSYTILQLDGRAFHTFTKGMESPFDDRLIESMNTVAIAVLEEVTNAKFAYVQSDEINIFISDFDTETTQAYFANRIQKVTSISSSVASATMSRLYPEKPLALFDARFFAVPDKHAAEEFFLWRQVDAIKNSIQSVGQSVFSHKELFQKKGPDIKDMLKEAGAPWEDFPLEKKQGRIVKREQKASVVSYIHKRTKETHTVDTISSPWVVSAAPSFAETNFLEEIIPDKE
jgi:tRNA(His) guanylyltransferase